MLEVVSHADRAHNEGASIVDEEDEEGVDQEGTLTTLHAPLLPNALATTHSGTVEFVLLLLLLLVVVELLLLTGTHTMLTMSRSACV